MKCIKFKIKDEGWDYYDPLEESDLEVTDTHYILKMAYTYEIPVDTVEAYEWYDLCDVCNYEVGDCQCGEDYE